MTSRQLRCLAACLTFLSTASQAANAPRFWRFLEAADTERDIAASEPFIENAEGHRLTLSRHSDGSIWGAFRISRASFDRFGNSLPAFRIDANDVQDLEDSLRLQRLIRSLENSDREYFFQKSKAFEWLIFHGGVCEVPRTAMLAQFMVGREITFRYSVEGFVGQKEAKFTLAGARTAIENGLKVKLASATGASVGNPCPDAAKAVEVAAPPAAPVEAQPRCTFSEKVEMARRGLTAQQIVEECKPTPEP
jgi:hypothetical protein